MVYSTLSYICNHAFRYGVTPMVTFDQPLWWKAMSILDNKPPASEFRQTVLRLGGFPILMSSLSAARPSLLLVVEKPSGVRKKSLVVYLIRGQFYHGTTLNSYYF